MRSSSLHLLLAAGILAAACTPADERADDAMKQELPSTATNAGTTSPSVTLFDGTLSGWRMSTIRNQPGRDDPGHFTVEDGALVAHPGTDLGLLWNTRPTPPDFL